MISARWSLGFVLVFLWLSPANGQVVQLPTFESFSISTTVVVPDRGTALLGGVDRAYYDSTWAGVPFLDKMPGLGRLFGNRSVTGGASSSSVSVTATIIDLQAMDEAVLAEARRQGASVEDSATARRAAFLARHVGRRESDSAGVTVPSRPAPPGSGEAVQNPVVGDSAQACLELARRAEAAGRFGAARCQYDRAARMAQGELRQEALSRLAALRDMEPRRPSASPSRH
jgi:hypothetical protein